MQVALAIISFMATVAGLAYKIWKQRQDARKLEIEVERWTKLAAAATKENVKLRSLLAAKEVALAAAKEQLAQKLSAAELAAALTELFGGKPGPGPAA